MTDFGVTKYRKLPVVVEAIRFSEDNENEVLSWARSFNPDVFMAWDDEVNPTIFIPTLEGEMAAHPGDYIIKGVNGEIYPCQSDIFWKTYEIAKDDKRGSYD